MTLKETDLYPPICTYLENLGYEVKGEVNHCDVVAVRHEKDEPPLIIELKTKLNLELILQASERLSLSESVYIAFPANAPLWRRNWRRVRGLCKRLGVGIITFQGSSLAVKIRLDPAPYQPRGSKIRKHRLIAEFEHRVGDPNIGGSVRQTIMTAYRQDALRCVDAIDSGLSALADIRKTQNLTRAGSIMQKNYYGWFERARRGHYQLSQAGINAAQENRAMIVQLRKAAVDKA